MAVAAGSLYLGLYLSNKAEDGDIKDMNINFSTDAGFLFSYPPKGVYFHHD